MFGLFGYLTVTEYWLLCRAKGNMSIVGWLSAFISSESAKK
jgi:hypothetical protein